MRRLLYLLAAMIPCQVAAAQFNPDQSIGAADPHNNEGMVFALPTGEQALYLTIVTHDQVDPNTRDAQVLAWFDQDPRLNKLKKQCNTNHYWHTNPHYATPQGKGGMGRCFGVGYPCVAITTPNGQILASAYYLNADGKRGKLPNTSSDLADLLWQSLDKELKAPMFASHSSTPGSAAAADCHPDDPNCPNPPPDANGPVLPERVPPEFTLAPYLKEFAPVAIVAVLVIVALIVIKSQQAAAPPAVAPPPPRTSFFS